MYQLCHFPFKRLEEKWHNWYSTALFLYTGCPENRALDTGIFQRNWLAWPHRRRGLASDGVRYADARSSVGRRFRSVTKLTKVRIGAMGEFSYCCSSAQNTHENGYNAQGVKLTFPLHLVLQTQSVGALQWGERVGAVAGGRWPLQEIRLLDQGLCTNQYYSWH